VGVTAVWGLLCIAARVRLGGGASAGRAHGRSARVPGSAVVSDVATIHAMPFYASDVQAIAESVTAGTVVFAVGTWAFRKSKAAVSWLTKRRHKELAGVLSSEVTAGRGWEAVKASPEVSLEAGIAYARAQTATGHPPYVPTRGFPTPDDPLDYLLDKMAETVWEAVTSAHSELGPYLLPMRNYLTALAGNAGTEPARDFALGVLTERVRQEEDGWPDHPGDPRGRRTAHGTGASHLCLLERKHQVEDAIYEALPSTMTT